MKSFILLMLFLCTYSFSATLLTSAVAGYTMENVTGGILQDVSPNNHDAINGLGGATIVSGLYGNALQFDGSDQVMISSTTNISPTSNFTVEAAFRVDGYTTGDWVRVIGKGSATYRNFGLWYHSSGRFLFQMYGAYGYGDAQYLTAVQTNTWYHMAGVYSGTTLSLYLNGSLVATSSLAGGPYTSSDPLTIGGADFHSLHVGLIDNAAVYNQVLSQSDIQLHAQGLSIGVVPEPTSMVLLILVAMTCFIRSKK